MLLFMLRLHSRTMGFDTHRGPLFRGSTKRVRWSASRRRVLTEAVVFPSGTTESPGGGRVRLPALDANHPSPHLRVFRPLYPS